MSDDEGTRMLQDQYISAYMQGVITKEQTEKEMRALGVWEEPGGDKDQADI